MNPIKVQRDKLNRLTDLPNVGPAMAADFLRLGFVTPQQLAGQNPLHLYERINALDGITHDPCVLDVFMSVVDFLNGHAPQPWWAFTSSRKDLLKRRGVL